MPGPRPAFHGGFRRQQIGEKNWPRVRRTNVLPLPPTITRTEKPQRRRLRLADYDYSQAGAYFVTICSRAHACLFGDVVEGEMLRNAAGNTVVLCWEEIPQHFPKVQLDAFVVMPNHVHGVLLFGENPERAGHARPQPVVVGSFKAAVSRRLGLYGNAATASGLSAVGTSWIRYGLTSRTIFFVGGSITGSRATEVERFAGWGCKTRKAAEAKADLDRTGRCRQVWRCPRGAGVPRACPAHPSPTRAVENRAGVVRE